MSETYRDSNGNNVEPRPHRFFNSCLLILCGFALAGILLFVTLFIIIGSLSSGIGSIAEQLAATKTKSLGDKYEYNYVSGIEDAKETVLIVQINGIIVNRLESSFGSTHQYTAADEVCEILDLAALDSTVRAVVISIDSPGGEVVASDRIYRAILNLRRNRTPVIAQMGSLAASGGYYIAAGCDYIIANPMTTTGSIGVIMSALKYYELMAKIGVSTENYTSGRMKDMLSGSRPTGIEEKTLVQQHINAVYEQFVQVVAEGRSGLTVEKIKNSEIGDGRIFLGTQALQLGMVDELGYEKDAELKAVKMANLKEYKVVRVRRGFSLMNFLMSAESTSKLNIALPGVAPYRLEAGKLYFLPDFQQ